MPEERQRPSLERFIDDVKMGRSAEELADRYGLPLNQAIALRHAVQTRVARDLVEALFAEHARGSEVVSTLREPTEDQDRGEMALLSVDPGLMREIEAYALRRGVPLGRIVDEALRQFLGRAATEDSAG